MNHTNDTRAVCYCRQRRLHRVGSCPALETVVSYPVLCPVGEMPEAGAVLRFNQTYQTIAETWLAWTEGPLWETVAAEFAAAGATAAYRFERRRASVLMTVETVETARPADLALLAVTRAVTLGGPAGMTRSRVYIDLWRWPDLTLASVTEGKKP